MAQNIAMHAYRSTELRQWSISVRVVTPHAELIETAYTVDIWAEGYGVPVT